VLWATTGERGDFSVAMPTDANGRLEARGPRAGSGHVNDVLAGDDVICVLGPGGSLRVSVRDAKNRAPLSGARVLPTQFLSIQYGTTDEHGFCEVMGVDSKIPATVQALLDGYAPSSSSSLLVKPGSETEVEIQLDPAPPLEGLVLDAATRRPLASAVIQ